MIEWRNEKPPNETLVEVEYEGGIIRARAIWGRDGMLPHWESEDRDTLWEPRAFSRWREVGSATQGASAERAGTTRRSEAPK